MSKTINCIIVDDHPAIRFAIGHVLGTNNINVLAECDNGIDAIKLSESLQPDIIVLDIDIPRLDGFAVICRLKKICPEIKILVLTATASESFSLRCYYAGTNGYITKADSIELIPNIIKQITSGYDFFSHNIHEITRKKH